MEADRIIPNEIKIVSILEPPYDINGKGAPTTGNKPETMPTLTKTQLKSIKTIPLHNNLPNCEDCRKEMIVQYNISKTKIIKTKRAPAKPNSSPIIVKIKSVCFSGKKSR